MNNNFNYDIDKIKEECGIFAIYSPIGNPNIVNYCYYGLLALQHRGQESCGVTFSNHGKLETIKKMGLVHDLFNDLSINYHPHAAISHVRYSTTGDSNLSNAQPLTGYSRFGEISVAHNGNLINTDAIKLQMQNAGIVFQSTTDSEVFLNLLSKYSPLGLEGAITNSCKITKGGFALLMLISGKLIAARDPYGIRPLCLGYLKNEKSYVVASESRALDVINAEFIRDIDAGEIIIIDKNEIKSIYYKENPNKKLCSFEYIYFAKADSYMDGLFVHDVRLKTGEALYLQNPIKADVVIGVPDSGVAAAIGFANASKIPYDVGFIRNRHIGRTFILPEQNLREQAAKLKLNPVKSVVNNKRVVVVDDSLVRGTTAKQLISILREAGAKEVHLRIASPMVKNVCYFGIDIPNSKDLVAHQMDVNTIKEKINADSLEYLSLENLGKSLGSDNFCKGCFTNIYPIKVDIKENYDNL